MIAHRWLVFVAVGGLLACGKKAHDAQVAPPAADGARALDAPAPTPTPLTPELLAQRFAACWASYDEGRWDAFQACHAPGAKFDEPGLANRYLDVDTKVADLQRLGIVAPGDRVAIELVIATDASVAAIVRVTGTEAGKPVQLRIGETVSYDATARIAEDTLYFDAAWKAAAAPAPAPVIVVPRPEAAEQDNNLVVERLLEAWSSAQLEAFEALVADDVTWTDHGSHQVMNKAALRAYLQSQERDLHGYHLEVASGSFAGDHVAVRGVLVGEIGEAYKKQLGARPTVNALSIPALGVFRVVNGKVVSAEIFWQSAALRAQLGLAP